VLAELFGGEVHHVAEEAPTGGWGGDPEQSWIALVRVRNAQ